MKDILKVLKKISILIVEDDLVSTLFFQELFANKAQKVFCVTTGEEAIETLKSNPDINLILLDIRLPGINGFETIPFLKEANPNCVIIAQTAYAHDNDRQDSLRAGCNDYIAKPIRSAELYNIIMKHFS